MDIETMAKSLHETFAKIPDPRGSRGKRHPLPAILVQATAAMLCGARSQYAIWQWGRLQEPATVGTMGFRTDKTPSASTLHELFAALDATAFEAALASWVQAYLPVEAKAIAIDGKQLCGIHGEELPGVRLVAAFSHESNLVLAQEKGAVPNTPAS
jgi:hypothetical protein